MMLKSLSRAVLVVAAVAATALFPVAVDAQLTAVSPNCMYAVGYPGFTPTPTACSGAWDKNDANQYADVLAQITADWGTGFALIGKTDAGTTSGPFSAVPAATSGQVVFDSSITGDIVLILKSQTFSMYYFNGVTNLGAIDFVMDGASVNAQGDPQALSHASLWTRTSTSVVPEPSTVVLLGTGLLALGLVGYRRREND